MIDKKRPTLMLPPSRRLSRFHAIVNKKSSIDPGERIGSTPGAILPTKGG
jgi:hypothetical protein